MFGFCYPIFILIIIFLAIIDSISYSVKNFDVMNKGKQNKKPIEKYLKFVIDLIQQFKAEGKFKEILDEMEVKEQDDEKTIFAFYDWKWYSDDELISNLSEELERISEEHGEDKFGLIVIGEDMAVVDEQGYFFDYSVKITW